ncbi:MAG: MATE family efflux transporter [Sphaerochaetaceae bacterium]
MPEENNALDQDFTRIFLVRFALPTIVMMIFLGLYTLVDTIFVSRFVNTNALSALNIVCPVINIIVGLGTMLATGGSAIIARKMGLGDAQRARQDFTLIAIAGAILGIIIAILGSIFLDTIIRALGSSEILYPYCKSYLSVLLFFTPASILQVLFQNLIVTAGCPGFGLVISLGGGVLNVILDYVFMVPLNMGIAGSALGTGIGYLVPALLGITFFLHTKGPLKFCKPAWHLKVLRESCSNGVSEMVGQLATAITTFLFNRVMMRFLGENGVAAITILIYSQFLLSAFYLGFSMGVAPIISYNYGSGNHSRFTKIYHFCLECIGSTSILVFISVLLFGSSLISVFSPKGTEVYEIARRGFLIFSFSFLFCGFNIFSSSTFTALSNGKVSAIISFSRTFGFLALALLILPRFLQITGVWLAVPLAEFLTLLLSIALTLHNNKTYHFFKQSGR